MDWLPSLFARRRKPDQAERVQAEFQRVFEAYQDARRRGDTRAQHDVWPELRESTTQRLRMGL